MAKQIVIWTRNAEIQMFSIMDYYADRNKSDYYSLKLKKAIDSALSKIEFSISIPQKTSIEKVYYFVHNHIRVLFTSENNKIYVVLVWDERRDPTEYMTKLFDLE